MCFGIAIDKYVCILYVCSVCIQLLGMSSKKVAADLHVHSQRVMKTRMANDNLYIFNKKESIKDFLNRVEFKCLVNDMKTSGSESRGQEEAASTGVFRPMQPLQ